MRRVGEQRERVGDDTHSRFDACKPEHEQERRRQRPSLSAVRVHAAKVPRRANDLPVYDRRGGWCDVPGVAKIYPDGTRAVNDLNLEIQDGEFLVLVGPSGCGKTTALRMVAGLEDISEGQLKIGDRVVNHVPPRDRDIAMVFQSYALYPHLTVYDNIAFSLKLKKVSKSEIDRRVQDAAKVLGLDPYLEPQAACALRGPAPAGRDGPGDRPGAGRLPDGRAALEPRCQAARPDPRRDQEAPVGPRHDDRLRHPRPGRGDDDGRPRRRDAQGRAAAGRRSAGALRPSGQSLRRRLHRQSGDEPRRGEAGTRRRRPHRGRRQPSGSRSARRR